MRISGSMNAQELSIQYWKDGAGAWQWQLLIHGKSAPERPRVVAMGQPRVSEDDVLHEIALVRAAATARLSKSFPTDIPVPINS